MEGGDQNVASIFIPGLFHQSRNPKQFAVGAGQPVFKDIFLTAENGVEKDLGNGPIVLCQHHLFESAAVGRIVFCVVWVVQKAQSLFVELNKAIRLLCGEQGDALGHRVVQMDDVVGLAAQLPGRLIGIVKIKTH